MRWSGWTGPNPGSISLVCEADDVATIEAIQRINPGPHIEIVKVPPSMPRTKPKALTYALSGARGTFVAVYDAEDRPHALQLREAYAAFRDQPDEVACVQAPLIISNASSSGSAPVSHWNIPAFSAACCQFLQRAGYRCRLVAPPTISAPPCYAGWEDGTYNVTEDADMGLRLHRLGYRCGVIRRQTLEDAPTSLSVWLNQRARWYKGWLQSWLVMTRSPFTTARRMGWIAYIVFQLLIGGMLLSSLAHPLLFVSFAFMAMAIRENGTDMLLSAGHSVFHRYAEYFRKLRHLRTDGQKQDDSS